MFIMELETVPPIVWTMHYNPISSCILRILKIAMSGFLAFIFQYITKKKFRENSKAAFIIHRFLGTEIP
jgi:hypothetical protein